MEYEYNDSTVLHIIRLLAEEYDSINAKDPDLIHQILFVTPEILTRIPQELKSEKYHIQVYDNETAIKDRFDQYETKSTPQNKIKELNLIQLESCTNKDDCMTDIQTCLRFELINNIKEIYVFIKDEFNKLGYYSHRENLGDHILDLTESTSYAQFIIQDYGDKLLKK
ncbi:MAG: hypothetical protein KAI18_02760 [Candidatus Aenigmarchaeota archaeon]|nr:hypothetical protein [Candidatus Aenigmarchaeota archaeon]